MKYCSVCLQTDTRPNGAFEKGSGICPACVFQKRVNELGWPLIWRARSKELAHLVASAKARRTSAYDCIIGVSGGKDSTKQAFYVRDELGMQPLLVCLAPPPEQITSRGVQNLTNLVEHDFNIITINPAPETWRHLMRLSFEKFVNPFKSTELALFSAVPRYAMAYGIPLIWWGENPAFQLGETSILGANGYDGNHLRNMNTLGNGDISWMLDAGFSTREIIQYLYPSQEEFNRHKTQIAFLGYFWNEWSMVGNGNFSALRGLDVRRDPPEKIGDIYGVSALDEDFTPVNQMIKYLKFGFGRVTENVNELIRSGVMAREEAIPIVEAYDGKCDEWYIDQLCDFMKISVSFFWRKIERDALNQHLFEKKSAGVYKPRFKVGEGLKN